MGNTNIPQFGAANADNSRDTRSGDEQLTDEQQRDGEGQGVGPAPSRPKNAPERIPGQDRDPAEPGPSDPYDPHNSAATDDAKPYGGHANTGHSPSDAT